MSPLLKRKRRPLFRRRRWKSSVAGFQGGPRSFGRGCGPLSGLTVVGGRRPGGQAVRAPPGRSSSAFLALAFALGTLQRLAPARRGFFGDELAIADANRVGR